MKEREKSEGQPRPEPHCCLCGERPRPGDWCEWQLEKGTPVLRCHELCVFALIRKAARERASGQGELFGAAELTA